MSLLTYIDLCGLIEDGVIVAPMSAVNGASIEVTLDSKIMIEENPRFAKTINLAKKENVDFYEYELNEFGYQMMPGEFLLASTVEVFNLPDNIVAEYVLKSSMARNGLNHLLAGYCDPGWTNSKLTLELHNVTRFHRITLTPGMKCGQLKFYAVERVPDHASYAVTGQYNNQSSVQASKGVR